MLIANKELHPDKMKKGQWVYIYQDATDLLSIEIQQIPGNEDYQLPHGLYFVHEVEDVKPRGKANYYPYKRVVIYNKHWDPEKDTGVMLVYANNGQLLLAGGQMFMCDVMFQVFKNIHELVEANEGQWNCAACGQKLTLPIGQMRVCGPCEKKLEVKKG